MDLGLNGKVVLVAAASKGLGYGTARALAREGARVSMCSREALDIEQAASTLAQEFGAETLGVACDVTDPAAIAAWVDQTVTRWGRIDGLFVNAGGPPAAYFKEISDDSGRACRQPSNSH